MNATDFNEVLERRIEQLRETLSQKGSEYAAGTDRLKNFKDTALMNECTPEQALWGFVSKHIIALKDFVYSKNIQNIPYSQIDEKAGDIICYCILLDALIQERKGGTD